MHLIQKQFCENYVFKILPMVKIQNLAFDKSSRVNSNSNHRETNIPSLHTIQSGQSANDSVIAINLPI
jgi:hypothetical protein